MRANRPGPSSRPVRHGFTLVELLVVVVLLTVIAAITIPNAVRMRVNATESGAVRNLRDLRGALETYYSINMAYPQGGGVEFRDQMYGAGANPCDAATAPVPDYGPQAFCKPLDGSNPGSKLGDYLFVYEAPAGGQRYSLRARPAEFGHNGTRAFLLDETGTIRHCTDLGASAASPPITEEPTAC